MKRPQVEIVGPPGRKVIDAEHLERYRSAGYAVAPEPSMTTATLDGEGRVVRDDAGRIALRDAHSPTTAEDNGDPG